MKGLYTTLTLAALCMAAPDLSAQGARQERKTSESTITARKEALWQRGEKRAAGAVISDASRGGVANDECSGAIALDLVPMGDCATANIAGDNSNATESGTPSCDDPADAGAPDVWFSFNSGAQSQVRISVEAITMTDLVVEVLDGCDGTPVGCVFGGQLDVDVTPGADYVVRVSSNMDYGVPGTFNICASYLPFSEAPENDVCGDVTSEDLAVGSTISFSGTTAGATNIGDFEVGSGLEGESATVWHSFTTTECSMVTISYCGGPSIFGNIWIFLSPSCPAGDDYILATNYNFTTCSDGNAVLTYSELPAGTYYVPVMFDVDVAYGEYALEVTAEPCPLFCAAGGTNATFETIENVVIGNFANPSAAAVGYEDFTALSVDMAQGASAPITVTIANAYESDEVRLWIDLDENNSFEASELLWTSDLGVGPHSGSIVIPAGTTLGPKRMRIRLHDSSLGGNPEPCGFSSYGQVEDYTAQIVESIGINDLTGPAFSIFPNPTNGDITINAGELNGNVRFELTDMTGRVVFAHNVPMVAGQVVTLPIAGKVASGMYNLSLLNNGARSVRTVVVR